MGTQEERPVGQVDSGCWLPCRPEAAVLWWDQELEAAWNEMWPPKAKRAPSGFRSKMSTPKESTSSCVESLRNLCE